MSQNGGRTGTPARLLVGDGQECPSYKRDSYSLAGPKSTRQTGQNPRVGDPRMTWGI